MKNSTNTDSREETQMLQRLGNQRINEHNDWCQWKHKPNSNRKCSSHSYSVVSWLWSCGWNCVPKTKTRGTQPLCSLFPLCRLWITNSSQKVGELILAAFYFGGIFFAAFETLSIQFMFNSNRICCCCIWSSHPVPTAPPSSALEEGNVEVWNWESLGCYVLISLISWPILMGFHIP